MHHRLREATSETGFSMRLSQAHSDLMISRYPPQEEHPAEYKYLLHTLVLGSTIPMPGMFINILCTGLSNNFVSPVIIPTRHTLLYRPWIYNYIQIRQHKPSLL
jgi:hypothetical protein